MKTLRPLLAALCIATSFIALTACVSKPRQEGTAEYVDDSLITGKVKAAILGDEQLKVMEINVETFKGVVQLSGFVSSKQSAQKAVEVARAVGGVKSVINKMTVK